jgi:uncharacterized protein (TIGR03083 family)
LIEHVGDMHRSWAAVARQRAPHPSEIDRAALRYSPEKGDLLDWYRAGLAEILDVLRTTPEDATFWTFWPPQRNVAFLRRRMAHETAVHRWDCEAAYGGARPIEPRLAADGVDELLTVYLPSWGKSRGAGETIGLRATDTGDEWLLRIGDGTLETTRDLAGAGGTVAGAASDVVLALWGRIPLQTLSTEGDLAPLSRLLAEADFD